ncbi:hemin uptake protein HemP [Variovorax terrae]|uniref:Hemin uptake protein HemP n=1 Tax=Variovorax terrae TaxID=2923278 RepID=A0A9X1VU25_9BURK|nr:hemin uptake protein HemP [Variovorax terrae]MCJ0763801.1 hemin uptake protein HemP [Variovorax terrae]
MQASLSSPASLGPQPHADAAGLQEAPSALRPQAVESADLLQGQKAVEIKHNGAVYRLQATKLGKLILTK